MKSNSHKQNDQGASKTFLDVCDRRLAKHLPVAQALRASSASVVNEIVSLANLQVERWEKNSLCSGDYIAAWRELLKQPRAAAAVLEERSARAAALRQNSPFVASIRKFQALAHAA